MPSGRNTGWRKLISGTRRGRGRLPPAVDPLKRATARLDTSGCGCAHMAGRPAQVAFELPVHVIANCWHAWAGGPTPNFGSGVRGVASRMYEANTSFDAHIITSFAHDFLQPHEKWLESIRGRMVKVGVVFPAAKGTSRVQRNIVARERARARAR